MAEPSAPRRTDPIAAALAFAIREAVRLEAERVALPAAPFRGNVGHPRVDLDAFVVLN